jgi:hypothetical protein
MVYKFLISITFFAEIARFQVMEIPIFGFWWAITTFLLGGVGLLYLYLTRTHDYWRKRGVPYVKPLPVFGNLKDAVLAKKTLGENYRDVYW